MALVRWLPELEINAGYLLQCCYKNEVTLCNLPAFVYDNLTAWEALSILGRCYYVADTLGIVLLIPEEIPQCRASQNAQDWSRKMDLGTQTYQC